MYPCMCCLRCKATQPILAHLKHYYEQENMQIINSKTSSKCLLSWSYTVSVVVRFNVTIQQVTKVHSMHTYYNYFFNRY